MKALEKDNGRAGTGGSSWSRRTRSVGWRWWAASVATLSVSAVVTEMLLGFPRLEWSLAPAFMPFAIIFVPLLFRLGRVARWAVPEVENRVGQEMVFLAGIAPPLFVFSFGWGQRVTQVFGG